MSKTTKNRRLSQKMLFRSVIIFLVILVIALGLIIFTAQQHSNVDCKRIIKESQNNINRREYSLAYDKLIAYKDVCGKAVTKNESKGNKVLKLHFHSRLAVAAYASNKKTLATEEAEKGLTIMDKNLNDSEKQSVQPDLITDIA